MVYCLFLKKSSLFARNVDCLVWCTAILITCPSAPLVVAILYCYSIVDSVAFLLAILLCYHGYSFPHIKLAYLAESVCSNIEVFQFELFVGLVTILGHRL